VEGWLDLAKLVASEGSKAKSPYEELAYQIGAITGRLQDCASAVSKRMSQVVMKSGWPLYDVTL
jgi:hypothetical protein